MSTVVRHTFTLASAAVALFLAACGVDAAAKRPAARALAKRPAQAPSATPAAPSEPTALTEAQKRRDAALAPLAAAVVDAFPNWAGSPFLPSLVADFSRDGKYVLFGSLRDGTPEVYLGETARPAEPPRALTGGPERALWAGFTHDERAVLFLRDAGGDENFAVWRVDVDGSRLTNLTPGEPLRRKAPMLPRLAPKTMLYAASKASEAATTLFSQSVDGGAPEVIYTSPKPAEGWDVTPDGRRVLFAESHSLSSSVVREVDVASGAARRVYPPEGKTALVFGGAYSPDGKRVYLATDEGGESSAIVGLDAATGRERARYTNESPKGAQMQVRASPKGDVLAVRVDAGNHGEVRLLDARTLALRRAVKVPLGDVQLGSFRADGGAFSVVISLPSQPPDLFAVDVKTGGLRPLRADKRPGLDGLPRASATVTTVPAFDGLQIPVNVYLPGRAGGEGARRGLPTVVAFHGGPAYSYSVRWAYYSQFFLALGYAVVEPNVRGSTGFGRAYEMADNREKRADWLNDLRTVNAWVKAQPWCDADRVVAYGASYGGYTTLMALTRQPTLWRAGVDLFGIADWKSSLRSTSAEIRSDFVDEVGDLEKDAALLDEFSPLRDVDKIVSPLFVYAGQNDPRVARSESDAIVKSLRARHMPVEYMVAPDEGHGLDRRATKIEFLTRVARFLEDSVKPNR